VSFEQPLKACRLLVIAGVKDNFSGQHAPDGTPWRPLKRPRDRERDRRAAARGGVQQVLRDTGILQASVTAQGARGNIDELTDRHLVFGTSLSYAAAHQYGAQVERPERTRPYPQKPWVFGVDGQTVFTRRIKAHTVTIPARPFLGLNEHVIGRVLYVFADFLSGLVR